MIFHDAIILVSCMVVISVFVVLLSLCLVCGIIAGGSTERQCKDPREVAPA